MGLLKFLCPLLSGSISIIALSPSNSLSALQETRLLTLIEGVLAANIFDWGSRACLELYHKGTIIEIYRMSRNKMQRPWRVTEEKESENLENT